MFIESISVSYKYIIYSTHDQCGLKIVISSMGLCMYVQISTPTAPYKSYFTRIMVPRNLRYCPKKSINNCIIIIFFTQSSHIKFRNSKDSTNSVLCFVSYFQSFYYILQFGKTCQS